MTPEQFNALTIMIHNIAWSVVKTSKLNGVGPSSIEYRDAVDASERSGKAIEQARALLVEQPAKEIKSVVSVLINGKDYSEFNADLYNRVREAIAAGDLINLNDGKETRSFRADAMQFSDTGSKFVCDVSGRWL